MKEDGALLSVRDLQCRRGGREVLAGVGFDLRAGEVLGVLGANGSGKSTLLATVAGELPLGGGRVALAGRHLAEWKVEALARRRALLPQSPSLSFDLDVRTVVGMGAYPFPALSPAELDTLVRRALTLADAQLLLDRRYLALSGGEQQRVQFARVLVQALSARGVAEDRLLLLDEPTSSLDPRHQLLLLGTVATLARDEGLAALVVLHDVNLAAQGCDRLLLLAGGSAVALGTPAEVLTPASLQRVYGVAARVFPHPLRAGLPLVLFGAA
jgi:iron complex transport system ATP-binding protein